MLLFVPPLEFRPPLPRTKISKALTTYETGQVGGVDALFGRPIAVEDTHYTIDPDCTHHVRNMAKTQITSFRLDRTNVSGNLFFRFKFTGASADYNFFSFNRASDRVRLWFASKVAINVWHTIRVDTGSDNVRRVYVNGALLYSGANVIDIGLYVKDGIDKFEIDAGQLGSPLLEGYEWL